MKRKIQKGMQEVIKKIQMVRMKSKKMLKDKAEIGLIQLMHHKKEKMKLILTTAGRKLRKYINNEIEENEKCIKTCYL